ncbi:hypothetical protein DIPPA_13706 [Diplonema papillatum]|nr:hypothetical protein DIPPA_13706 [Diplonema papillatum]
MGEKTKKGSDGEKVVIPEPQSVYMSADGVTSVVLDDGYDPEYLPTDVELLEYANWLGMNPDDDQPLMWIAREGLRSPLPQDWRPCQTDTKDIYYFNFRTGESIWDHPLDSKFKLLYKQEKTKRDSGKPFKREPDDDVHEFLYGEKPGKGKKSEKGASRGDRAERSSKKPEGGLPSTLSLALTKAAAKTQPQGAGSGSLLEDALGSSTRSKGKFSSLPTPGMKAKPALGNLGGLGIRAEEEDLKPVISASALGRQALPGLGSSMKDSAATPSPLVKTSPLGGPLKTAATFASPNRLSSPFADAAESSLGASTSRDFQERAMSDLVQKEEDRLQKELERLREEHAQRTEEERRLHEQKQKRMRYTLEQEMQDLALELDQKKNEQKRKNALREAEWERELEENSAKTRRKFERELQEGFDRWKDEKETAIEARRAAVETAHRSAVDELAAKKERLLKTLQTEQAAEIEQLELQWKSRKDNLEREGAELEKREADLKDRLEEIKSKEKQASDDLQEVEDSRRRLLEKREELRTLDNDDTAVRDLSEKNGAELRRLLEAHEAELARVRNKTKEDKDGIQRELREQREALEKKHRDSEAELKQAWDARKETLLAEQRELESEVAKKRDAFEEMRARIDEEKGRAAALRAENDSLKRKTDELAALEETLRGNQGRREADGAAEHDTEGLHASFEAEITQARERHSENKRRLEEQLAAEERVLDEKKARCQAKLSEIAEKEREAEEQLDGARTQHQREMDRLRESFEADADAEEARLKEEHSARIDAERERLEQCATDALADLQRTTDNKLARKRAELEAALEREIAALRAATDTQKRELLERVGDDAMQRESAEADEKIARFRRDESERVKKAISDYEAELRQVEKERRQTVEKEARDQYDRYEEAQRGHLDTACERSRVSKHALVSAQRELDAELLAQRRGFESELAALTEDYRKKTAEKRRSLEEAHDREMAGLRRTQEEQLAAMKARHQAEVGALADEQAAAVRQKRGGTAAEMSSVAERHREVHVSLANSHEREVAELKLESRQQLLEQQRVYDDKIRKLKTSAEHEVNRLRSRAHARQYESLRSRVKHRAAVDLSPGISDGDALSPRPATHLPARSYHDATPDPREVGAVRSAKMFIRFQKKELGKRQEDLERMRAKWDHDAKEIRRSGSTSAAAVLQRAKRELDKEAADINAKVKEIRDKEYWLRERIRKVDGASQMSDASCGTTTCDTESLTPHRPRHARGHRAADDPRVLMALSSLANQVQRLTQKLGHLQQSAAPGRSRGGRRRSSQRRPADAARTRSGVRKPQDIINHWDSYIYGYAGSKHAPFHAW